MPSSGISPPRQPTGNRQPIAASLERVHAAVEEAIEEALSRGAQEVKDHILTRTTRGYDARGVPFKPYSSYTVRKKKTTQVTLYETGEMLGALAVGAPARGLRHVYISPHMHMRALRHQKGGPKRNLPQRAFFGVTKEARQDIIMAMQSIVLGSVPRGASSVDVISFSMSPEAQ